MDRNVEVQLATKLEVLSTANAASSLALQKDLLDFIKTQKLRQPRVVTQHGMAMLRHHGSQLGDDVWLYYERVFMAALDCHDARAQAECLEALEKKFPDSLRVKKLVGMQLELQQDFAGALELYEAILEANPADKGVMKRKICVYEEQGDTQGTIKELNAFLKVFCSDEQGWQKLLDLYIGVGRVELAKFACEELLLLVPENYLYHLQYAELVYTLGGKPNFLLARQYFAQSLELKREENLRALYGLILCLRLKGSNKLASELYSWSVEEVMKEYRRVTSPAVAVGYHPAAGDSVSAGDDDDLLADALGRLDFTAGSRAQGPINPNPLLPYLVHASLQM